MSGRLYVLQLVACCGFCFMTECYAVSYFNLSTPIRALYNVIIRSAENVIGKLMYVQNLSKQSPTHMNMLCPSVRA